MVIKSSSRVAAVVNSGIIWVGAGVGSWLCVEVDAVVGVAVGEVVWIGAVVCVGVGNGVSVGVGEAVGFMADCSNRFTAWLLWW